MQINSLFVNFKDKKMTTKTIKKITKNTTPSNANKKQVSHFKNLLNLANKTDDELTKLNITKTKICDDIVKMFKGLDLKQFETKQLNAYIDNDIYLKRKGHKNSKTAKPLTGTFKTVISAIKSYINDKNIIDTNTTYKTIRQHQNAKNKPTISEKRKAYNKRLATLSDNDIKSLLALFDAKNKK